MSRSYVKFTAARAGLAALLCIASVAAGFAQAQPQASPLVSPPGDTRIPRPAALERDVQFWIRVYSEIPTSAGFMHDDRNLAIVYETLRFAPNLTPQQRKPTVDEARERYQQLLRRLAAALSADAPAAGPIGEVDDPARAASGAATGATRMPVGLSDEEKRVLALWGPGVTPARLLEASRSVRFQLGQADRFREGLVRSGRWETHIAQSLANLGLPPELAALPHVESSFDPTAYSKVGAAGLWQFMRETGRRYMRIDDEVLDERLDPFRATEAAAQLLAYNYRVLGTWPLALTAYNHGAAGMRRAVEQTGTTDFVTIARNYQSRTFGFASRNFYPSFLAALTIDQNPEKYFSGIQRAPELRFHEVETPAYATVDALARTLGTTREVLRDYNPGLRDPVWRGARFVPKGYRLRLGAEAKTWTPERLAAALGPGELYSAQIRSGTHRVASGETLARVARRYGIGERELAQANGIAVGAGLRRGQRLRLPEIKPPTLAEVELAAVAARVASRSSAEPAAITSTVVASTEAAGTETASVAATDSPVESLTPSVGPGTGSAAAAEFTDIMVARDDTIRVISEETLGHYADWLGVPASRLRALNKLRPGQPVLLGQRLKLDFSRVARTDFEQKRRDFHGALQTRYFENQRITGTEIYIVRRGDSAWAVTQRYGGLPTWLLQQYNPEVDLGELRAGIQLIVPRVQGAP